MTLFGFDSKEKLCEWLINHWDDKHKIRVERRLKKWFVEVEE